MAADSSEREYQMPEIWVRGLHIRFGFAVALLGLSSWSQVVDGQDLVGFVLGSVAFATLKQRPAKAFAVRGDAVELTNFALLLWCVDARWNNVWPIEIRLTSSSHFAVVAIVVAVAAESVAVECALDWLAATVAFGSNFLWTTTMTPVVVP